MNVYLKKQHFHWQKIAIGIVALILFVGFLNLFQSPIKNTFYYLTAPVSNLFWKAGDNMSGFFGSFLHAGSLTQENNNLQQQNQQLLSQIASLQNALQQDKAIKEVVQNTRSDNFKMILAQSIGLDSANDVVLLNRGSSDGIGQNMPVISSTKVLIGKVSRVYKNFCQIMLISSKDSVVAAQILPLSASQDIGSSGQVSGVIKGSGNLSMYLDLVASDQSLHQQDVVTSSALEGIYPKGLLIGKISSIDSNDVKPFQTANILPFFDIKNMDNLFIITDYKK